MRCRVGSMVFAASLLAVPAIASAQQVDVRVMDERGVAPVSGALVSLVAGDGATIADRLTNADGRVTVRVTQPGRVTIRVRRIGFQPFTSDAFQLGPGEVKPLALRLPAIRVVLPRVTVASAAADCGRDDAGRVNSPELWQSISAALAATVVTTRDSLARTSVETFERRFDPGGALLSERHEPYGTTGSVPFVTAEPRTLSDSGYVVTTGVENHFYAPDARVLLSPYFLADHCFGAVPGSGPTAGLVGLAFRPVRARRVSDVAGVLWVDTTSSELRFLEFKYVNTHVVVSTDSIGGRLDFERLPSGAWITRHWQIRFPELGPVKAGTRSRTGVTAYIETGADATIAAVSLDRGLAAGAGRVAGVIFDSVAGRPTADARIGVLGSSIVTRSDSVGAFRLDSVPAGRTTIFAEHESLDTLGLPGIAMELTVVPGSRTTLRMATPSYPTLWHRACGAAWAPPVRADSGFIYGSVHDLAGAQSRSAVVAASWVESRATASGSASARVWTVSTKTDSAGTFAICGVPDSIPLRLFAYSADGGATDRLDIDFAGRRMLRRDVTVGPIDTSSAAPHGTIRALVTDSSGTPVPNALVRVGPREARSNADGKVSVRDAPAGSRRVDVLAIGFAPLSMSIELAAGDTAIVDLQLQRVTGLAPVVVVASSAIGAQWRAEIESRRKVGLGYFTDSTRIAEHGTLLSVLLSAPDTRVAFSHGLDFTVSFSGRGGKPCLAGVWIDGRHADFEQLNFYRASDIAIVEVFSHGSLLPARFRSFEDLCGAVIVWTKVAFR